jgi:hypothetical protein
LRNDPSITLLNDASSIFGDNKKSKVNLRTLSKMNNNEKSLSYLGHAELTTNASDFKTK